MGLVGRKSVGRSTARRANSPITLPPLNGFLAALHGAVQTSSTFYSQCPAPNVCEGVREVLTLTFGVGFHDSSTGE